MRQAAVVGITLAVIMVFGQVLVSNVGMRADYARAATLSADDAFGPALQTTATAAASPATNPGALPEAGAESNAYLILLGAIMLIVLGASAVLVTSTRRGNQP